MEDDRSALLFSRLRRVRVRRWIVIGSESGFPNLRISPRKYPKELKRAISRLGTLEITPFKFACPSHKSPIPTFLPLQDVVVIGAPLQSRDFRQRAILQRVRPSVRPSL